MADDLSPVADGQVRLTGFSGALTAFSGRFERVAFLVKVVRVRAAIVAEVGCKVEASALTRRVPELDQGQFHPRLAALAHSWPGPQTMLATARWKMCSIYCIGRPLPGRAHAGDLAQ